MRNRFVAALTAAITTVSVAAVAAPVPAAFAQEMITENLTKPVPAPTSSPQDVILQVGASESEALVNWITAEGISGQVLQFAEAGTPIEKGTVVKAKSSDYKFNLSEGYHDEYEDPATIPSVMAASHKAGMTGLKENTEYSYRVGSEKDGFSDVKTFNTGTFGDEWNFLFTGDVQLYADKDLAAQSKAWNDNISFATKKYPNTSFILSAGDQANYSAMQENSGFIAPEAMKKYRTAVNMGNHELVDPGTYEATYNRPNLEDENYFYTYNNALIVSLDSNDWKDLDDDIAYLRKTVKEQGADKDWVILTYHHSSFSQAYHMEDRQVQYWRENLTPVISELGIDLVLGGHDHIYTRSYLMDGYNPVDAGRKVEKGETLYPKEGEVQYVAANSGSGSKFYKIFDFKNGVRDESDNNITDYEGSIEQGIIRDYTAFWDQDLVADYTNIEVTADTLKVSTFDTADDELVDEFTLAKTKDSNLGDGNSSAGTDSSDSPDSEGSSSPLAWLAPVLAVLAVIGGAVAAFAGVIPGVSLKF